MIMGNNAHSQLDTLIEQNKRNPQNIKNEVMTETIKIPENAIFPDYLTNIVTAIAEGETEGGEKRYYMKSSSMPSSFGHPEYGEGTRRQVMQMLLNAIKQSPQDTIPRKEVEDYYKFHKMPMPK